MAATLSRRNRMPQVSAGRGIEETQRRPRVISYDTEAAIETFVPHVRLPASPDGFVDTHGVTRLRLQYEERLAILDGLAVLDENLTNGAVLGRFDLGVDRERLDGGDGLPLAHGAAEGNEWFRAWLHA